MQTVSLYRIMKGKTTRFCVGQCYIIHTEQPCQVPHHYERMTPFIHQKYAKWFETQIFPVLERHNGDYMIEKWAVPTFENPDHVTVAICIGDTLVCPDMLANTTSICRTKEDEIRVWTDVEAAIAKYHTPDRI